MLKMIYKENRIFIFIYIGLVFFVSVWMFGNGSNIATKVFADTSLTEIDSSAIEMGGSFANMITSILLSSGVAINPSLVLGTSTIASIISDFTTLPQPLDTYSFGLLEYWPVRIFMIIWAICSILPRCFGVTHVGGLVIENVENKCAAIITLFINGSQVFAETGNNIVAHAATSNSVLIKNSMIGFLYGVVWIISMILLLISYFFVRIFLFYIDILLLPICTIVPTVSFVTELIKAVVTVTTVSIALFSPVVYCILFGLLLIVAIAGFKKAYISVRYFKNIYVKPFFANLKGYNKEITLIDSKAPKQLMKQLEGKAVQLLIPIYPVKNVLECSCIKKHDQWWLVKINSECYIYNIPLFSQHINCVKLLNMDENRIYIKKSLQFFEIVTFTEKNEILKPFLSAKKKLHFVLSKEYCYKFEDIKHISAFYDYALYHPTSMKKVNFSKFNFFQKQT